MRTRAIVGIGVVVFAMVACRSTRDDPTGIILVGSPEVSTRERLVNDRLTQDGWLRKQLSAADALSFDDFQGLLDERALTALSVNASINANPNDLALQNARAARDLQSVEEETELSSLEHEIAVLQRRNQIANLRSNTIAPPTQSTGDTSQTGGTGTGTTQTTTTPATGTPATAPVDFAGNLLTRLGSSQRAGLPDPSHLQPTKAKSSPIEALRDRLAYREEIRNEILENQLDDRHDLVGNTLYRFNIDATMIPSAGNSAWAIVDVEVENFDKRPTADLYADWVHSFQSHFEREINSQFVRTLRCLGDLSGPPATTKCGLGTREMEELLAYGSAATEYYAATLEAYPSDARTYDQQVKLDLRGLLRRVAGSNDEPSQRQVLQRLIAEKVRADYFDRHRLGDYIPRPAVGTENCPEGSAPPGRVVTWCSAAPILAEPEQNSPHVTCVRAIRALHVQQRKAPRDLRQIRFQCALTEVSHVYAYSATPKDSVQRISRVAAARNTLELAAAISALTGAASINTATAFIRDNQRLMQGILREPLVVGYTEAGQVATPDPVMSALEKANFGWLIGPRFGLGQKPFGGGERINMDHRPIQNSLAAAVSLPGWANRAKVTIRTCWKSKRSIHGDSKERCKDSGTVDSREHYVELPGRIDAIHSLLVNRADPMPQGWETYEVVTGSRAALLIKGTNLWRSTEVTLGAQTADEIRVLPDMTGIIARFDRVQEPAALDGGSPRTVDVNIWTSGGNQAVGEAKIYPQKKSDATWKIAWRKPRLIKDEEIALELVDGALPASFSKMDLVVEGFDTGNAKWTEPVRLTGTARDKVLVAKLTDVPLLSSGMEVRGSIWTLLRPDSAAVDLKATADSNAIYYANAADAKIKTPTNVKPGGKLTFTFPKRVAQAFPGFQRPKATTTASPAALVATLSGENWTQNSDGQDVLEYTVAIAGAIDPAGNPKLLVKLGPLADGLVVDKTEIQIVP